MTDERHWQVGDRAWSDGAMWLRHFRAGNPALGMWLRDDTNPDSNTAWRTDGDMVVSGAKLLATVDGPVTPTLLAALADEVEQLRGQVARVRVDLDALATNAGHVALSDIPDWLMRVAASVRQLWVDEPATVVMDEDGVGDGMPTADELDLIAMSLRYSIEAVQAALSDDRSVPAEQKEQAV